MPVTIRRTCKFCTSYFDGDRPSCDCCPSCGGTADGDYSCDVCEDARRAMKAAARQTWAQFLRSYNESKVLL